uniref:Uncharacterized protein n=1 Tax=Glossina palpalis gambiensis TaxID=67801 RepID=A0A1B0C708_9MUSC
MVKKFITGIFSRTRRDDSRQQIRLLFDYPHTVSALPITGESDIKELIEVMTKTCYAKSRFWVLKAAIPNPSAPFATFATFEFFRPAALSYFQAAINAKVLPVDTSLANEAGGPRRVLPEVRNILLNHDASYGEQRHRPTDTLHRGCAR